MIPPNLSGKSGRIGMMPPNSSKNDLLDEGSTKDYLE